METTWLAAFLAPALIVLAIHALVIGAWQKGVARRVRRRTDSALILGDLDAVRRAAADTAVAQRDWPGIALWQVGGALEIARRRLEGGSGRPGRA